jgi:hypothetical protein
MRLATILFLLVLTACNNHKDTKPLLNKNDIAYIEINKHLDTSAYRLTAEQVDRFLARWASGVSKGPLKYTMPYYHLTVHFKNDSSTTFEVRDDLLKHRLQQCVSIGDKTFLEELWFTQAGLSSNHHQFYITYKEGEEVFQLQDRYDAELGAAIKQVLTYYNYPWIDIEGRIYYEGDMDDNTMLDYTTKAKDSEWLATHK